jgi:Ca2+/H+ antiporter, TMEM165/GDT1 family
MRARGRWVFKGLALAGFLIVGLAVLSAAVMLLWNALLPQLLHVPPLRYLQAAGILILSRLLFGGLRLRHGPWRHRAWRERWESLTPEERERLREKFGRHCGWHAAAHESDNQPL